jgi:hypothetical protein
MLEVARLLEHAGYLLSAQYFGELGLPAGTRDLERHLGLLKYGLEEEP